MIRPVVATRVKKANHLPGFGVNRFRCCGFIGITVTAGKGQILTNGEAALRFGDDVFNFKENW